MLTIDERIENGIRWLDQNFPGWIERVDLDTLALSDPFKCICGQVFDEDGRMQAQSGFTYAVTLLNEANSWISSIYGPNSPLFRFRENNTDYFRGHNVAILLGFETARNESYWELTDAWKEFLR